MWLVCYSSGQCDHLHARSGCSLVVEQLAIDQKVVGSNPAHDRNNSLCALARLPGLFGPFDKTSTSFWWPGSPRRAGT